MPAIITREGSQRRLGDFINTVKTEQSLYIGLGKRSTTWAGSPDQIENTPQEKIDFWDELIGLKKVAIKDIIPMIPDRRWVTGTSYTVFDPSKEQAYDDEFYVITTSYEVFMVTVKGGGASTDMPTKAQSGVSLSDGYTWEYMYSVNRYEYQQTPNGWLSVNYGTSIDYSDTAQNFDAFVKLGAQYLLVRCEITDPDISGEFSAGAFRQIGLVSHPRLDADDSLVSTEYEDIATLKSYSGYLIYLENREQEDVISGQNSDIKITLRF